jgi:hypothetical protein
MAGGWPTSDEGSNTAMTVQLARPPAQLVAQTGILASRVPEVLSDALEVGWETRGHPTIHG